jgi:hypothetical protein
MYWPGLHLRRCLWVALHPPPLESIQKNPSSGLHRTSDVGVHDFFTFRPRPVNHNSYRGTWENLRVHNFWYKHEQHNFWYKHEQLNLSDIHMNNTTASSAQHMGVAWGAFPFNNIDVPGSHSVQLEHCFCPLRPSLKVSSGHFEHNVLAVAVQSLWTLYPVGKNVKVCCLQWIWLKKSYRAILDNSLTTAGLMDSYHQDMQGSRAVPLCIHPRDTMVMQY